MLKTKQPQDSKPVKSEASPLTEYPMKLANGQIIKKGNASVLVMGSDSPKSFFLLDHKTCTRFVLLLRTFIANSGFDEVTPRELQTFSADLDRVMNYYSPVPAILSFARLESEHCMGALISCIRFMFSKNRRLADGLEPYDASGNSLSGKEIHYQEERSDDFVAVKAPKQQIIDTVAELVRANPNISDDQLVIELSATYTGNLFSISSVKSHFTNACKCYPDLKGIRKKPANISESGGQLA